MLISSPSRNWSAQESKVLFPLCSFKQCAAHTQRWVGKAIWLYSSKNWNKENNCNAWVNLYRSGAAIELEPVDEVYRFHRNRMMCVRQTSRCEPNTSMVADEIAKIESQCNDMWNKTSSCIKEEWLDLGLEIADDGHRTVTKLWDICIHTQVYCANCKTS